MGTTKIPSELTKQRIYCDEMSKSSKQSTFSALVAVVTLLIFMGWMHIMLAMLALSFFYKGMSVILLILLCTLALPAKPVLWHAFCRQYIFKTWREYFHFSYLFEAPLDTKKKYVFVEFPHGVFPLGPLLGATASQLMEPRFDVYSLGASSVFSVPFWRHVITWLGCVGATTENFRRKLKRGSVAVIVGGIAEMYMQREDREQIKLRDRKGFVRVAVESGSDGIVPVYHFGNSQLLDFYPQSWSRISRRLRAALGFVYGRFGLPLPRKVELFMVCGKPIPVRQVDRSDPSFAAAVEELHAKVVQAVQKLYDDHKAEYGWADRPLEVC
uniref:Acyltransferase n=1 Tax=Polytomella parva TaxID=51329 RepID=A0A7S0YRY4_9CHLO|mmetsp:Transcript_34265/g.61821  ORF Transcript_34265/g.61821 Transcript_34265/m.61821 type:complete len:327 (+) Transcript_34265:41-1021(+)